MQIKHVAAYREGPETTIVLKGTGLEGADPLDAADIVVHKLRLFDATIRYLGDALQLLEGVENAEQIRQNVENIKREVCA